MWNDIKKLIDDLIDSECFLYEVEEVEISNEERIKVLIRELEKYKNNNYKLI